MEYGTWRPRRITQLSKLLINRSNGISYVLAADVFLTALVEHLLVLPWYGWYAVRSGSLPSAATLHVTIWFVWLLFQRIMFLFVFFLVCLFCLLARWLACSLACSLAGLARLLACLLACLLVPGRVLYVRLQYSVLVPATGVYAMICFG